MTNKKIAFVEQAEYKHPNGVRPWWSEHCAEVARGLQKLGFTVHGFTKDKLASCNISRETPVRGSIRTTRRALELIGVPQPKNVDIPVSLRKFAHRKIWETTLGEIRAIKKPTFVKSLETQKAWNGHVVFHDRYGYISPEGYTRDYPNDYKVLASEPVKFWGEYRFYVIDGKLVRDCSRYDRAPVEAKAAAQEIVENYTDAPIGYALDVGRMGDYNGNKWALVEINEGFSAGNDGGASEVNYARMNAARWYEIVGLPRRMRAVIHS